MALPAHPGRRALVSAAVERHRESARDCSHHIIVLDAIVYNEARHGRNLLATGEDTTTGMTIWAIDADEALIGHVGEFARLELR